MSRRRKNYGWIDPKNPINKNHILNKELRLWLLASRQGPCGVGSNIWRDLSPYRHNGTLTNMDPATDWVGATRPGGFGALDLDGSNDSVVIGNPATLIPNAWAGFTISVWFKRTALSQWDTLIDKGKEFNDFNQIDINFGIRNNNRIRFDLSNGSALTGIETGSTAIDAGTWRHYIALWDGTTTTGAMRVFRDGVLIESGTAAYAISTLRTTGTWAIGGDSAGLFSGGQFDDVRIMSRAMSDAEAMALHLEAARRYPSLINRIRVSVYAPGGAPPVTASRLLNLRRRAVA